ncbi:hypothetical protein LRC39_17855 [Rhodopseudomonas sp. P1]|uniref:hypothetical protein n=1 Tax=Rhodopseudomonas sp. P1 TaxID=3434357 RepID=UPI0031FD2093
MLCNNCGCEVRTFAERCHVCNADVGFPNVRAAADDKERSALAQRVRNAQIAATARGSTAALQAFGTAVSSSNAVLARPLGDLEAFVKSDNVLYISYHSQVRSGARIPEENEWDKGREAAESTINPVYFGKINYTALSLDGFGVLWWGEYSVVLREKHIALRTSVFEENPFIFCERHRVAAGKSPPKGFRATWDARQDLAIAKLSGKIAASTENNEYASILLNQGTSRANADFIECHTFGPIHRTSIERVVGPRPKDPRDLIIWRSVVATLQKIGAIVEEV